MDVMREPDAADLATIPASIRGHAVEAAVEVQIIDQQSLNTRITIPLGHLLLQEAGAVFMKHFVGLEIDPPGAMTRVHRPLGFLGQHGVAALQVPFALDDVHARVADPGHDLARLVIRFADVYDDFVAHAEDREDRRDDRKIQLHGIANERECGQHVQLRNCRLYSRRYNPSADSRSPCVPRSTMRPSAITTIKSACCTVARRWAITNT